VALVTSVSRPLTYEESLRVLLQGVSGVNLSIVSRGSGVDRFQIAKFVAGKKVRPDTLANLGLFVFRQMNSHVLLSKEDLVPEEDTPPQLSEGEEDASNNQLLQ
jgi:hypothetical protein